MFTASSCSYGLTKYGSTSLCDQNYGLQSEDRHTHTHRGTDKTLKTEGPMILSNDIFFLKTVIIGGPIMVISESIFKVLLPPQFYLVLNAKNCFQKYQILIKRREKYD